MPVPKYNKLVLTFAEGISQFEGYHDAGTVARRNNNPGNLRSWGSNEVIDGFARFPTVREGWEALYSQVNKNLFERGLTIDEFFAGRTEPFYAGYLGRAAQSSEIDKYARYMLFYLQDRGFYPISRLTVLSKWYEFEQNNDIDKGKPFSVDAGNKNKMLAPELVYSDISESYGIRVGDKGVVNIGKLDLMIQKWEPVTSD